MALIFSKPRFTGARNRSAFPNGGQLAQMGDDIRSHTRKIGSCLIDVLFMDTDRQIPFLIEDRKSVV